MDLAPLFRLRLRTPHLELRLPSPAEVLELFAVAESGIHPADEMPFGVAWTDHLDRDDFAAFHAAALASWTPERWDCNFVTFRRGGGAIGTQSLHGRDFGATREVSTGSWLGQAHQGHGFGTEQRAAVLELAFRTLDALAAVTGALVHNRASQRVSEKLGYRFTHEDTLSPRGTPVPRRNYRLERDAWASPIPIEITGAEPCLPLFGVAGI